MAEARNDRNTPRSMTYTNRTANGLSIKGTRRSGRGPAKEMDAIYAVDHTAMIGAPR